jgi:hypothetical protein
MLNIALRVTLLLFLFVHKFQAQERYSTGEIYLQDFSFLRETGIQFYIKSKNRIHL